MLKPIRKVYLTLIQVTWTELPDVILFNWQLNFIVGNITYIKYDLMPKNIKIL